MKRLEEKRKYLITTLAALLSVVIAAVIGTFIQQLMFGRSSVAVTVGFAIVAGFGISRTIWQSYESKASRESVE